MNPIKETNDCRSIFINQRRLKWTYILGSMSVLDSLLNCQSHNYHSNHLALVYLDQEKLIQILPTQSPMVSQIHIPLD